MSYPVYVWRIGSYVVAEPAGATVANNGAVGDAVDAGNANVVKPDVFVLIVN